MGWGEYVHACIISSFSGHPMYLNFSGNAELITLDQAKWYVYCW
jgi:hypothetical protein